MIIGGRAKNLGYKPDKKQQTFNIYWPKRQMRWCNLPWSWLLMCRSFRRGRLCLEISVFLGVGTESHGEGDWKVKRLEKFQKMFGKDVVVMEKVGWKLLTDLLTWNFGGVVCVGIEHHYELGWLFSILKALNGLRKWAMGWGVLRPRYISVATITMLLGKL